MMSFLIRQRLEYAINLLLLFLASINTHGQNHGGTSVIGFLEKSFDFGGYRPIIYTFIHVEGTPTSLEQTPMMVWAEAWADAGWDPVVLSEVDSMHHPQYEYFVNKLYLFGIPKHGWNRFLRYFAMSLQEDGGYYTQPYVFPIDNALSFHESDFELPNSGKFTMHNEFSMSLLSGSKEEWNRVTNAIIYADNENIRSDLTVLRLIYKENPTETILEDSFIDVRYVLSLKKKHIYLAKHLCRKLQNKKAIKLMTGVRSLGYYNHHDFYKGLKLSLNQCKPTMHTFFELAYGDGPKKRLLLEVEEWKTAWESAGWNPIILTLADAKRHPIYASFATAFKEAKYKTSLYDQMCFYRWLAMATFPGGGWMSDFDTYPLHLYQNNKYKYNLQNDGNFTSNAYFIPNLISGSGREWNRMVKLLFYSYRNNSDRYWSDMLALQEIIRQNSKAYIYTMDAPELHTLYTSSNLRKDVTNDDFESERICSKSKGKLAVHFSHATCGKIGFCHGNRGPILNKWLKLWRLHCLDEL